MRQKEEKQSTILVPLLLYLVFAGGALILILFGANVYQKTVSNSKYRYNSDTVISYIQGKIHAFDTIDTLKIESFDGQDCLMIYQVVEGSTYCTKIYSYDGYLRELFIDVNFTDMPLDSGTKLIPIQSLKIEPINNHLIKFSCIDEKDHEAITYINVRTPYYES